MPVNEIPLTVPEDLDIHPSLLSFITTSTNSVLLLDKEMRHRWSSSSWDQLFKIPKEEHIGKNHYDVFPTIPDNWKKAHERCLQGAVERCDNDSLKMGDGKQIFVRWEIYPWHTPKGLIGGIVINGEDITVQKNANLALEEKIEERTKFLELHRVIVQNMAEALCLVKIEDGSFVYTNARFKSLFGFTDEELLGKCYRSLQIPENFKDINTFHETLEQILDKKSTDSWEELLRKKDSSTIWCNLTVSMSTHPQYGRVFVTMIEDIHIRKMKSIALEQSEKRHREIVELAGDGIVEVDMTGRYIQVNKAMCEMTGFSREEMLSKKVVDIVIPEDWHQLNKSLNFHLQSSQAITSEWRIRSKDGRIVHLEVTGKTFPGDKIISTIRNVTERKKYEDQHIFLAKLTKSLDETLNFQDRKRRIVNSIVQSFAELCFIFDSDENELKINVATSREPKKISMLNELVNNADVQRVLSESCRVFKSGRRESNESPLDPMQPFLQSLDVSSYVMLPLSTQTNTFGTLFIAVGQKENQTRFMGSDLPFLSVMANRCAISLENASLVKELTQQVTAREKVLSIVSHDLKTPLASVEYASEVLLERTLSKDTLLNLSRRLKVSSATMQVLISDLLDFGKIQAQMFKVNTQSISPDKALALALGDIKAKALEHHIHLETDIALNMPNMKADPIRFNQVLWNIAGNAIKFSPPGKKVKIEVREVPSFIQFTVRDEGPGIAATDLPKIFDLYWQVTKTAQQGTGLGLSIAKGFTEAQGGHIFVESTLGLGSTFTFTLPIDRDRPKNNVTYSTPTVSEMSSSLLGVRVLVVDDSEDNLVLCSYYLKKAGAFVAETLCAAEALEKLKNESFDIVITDIEMPDINGYEFVDKIRVLPGDNLKNTPVIAVSAHDSLEEIKKMQEASFIERLHKPVKREQLIAVILSVLKRRSQ